jgi:hypothetical protein
LRQEILDNAAISMAALSVYKWKDFIFYLKTFLMSKYISIQIPTTCHEDWDSMTAATQGRYCNSCEKTVIDFTNMSDTQLANFFAKKKENVCGRFYSDQLDTAIAIPKREIPWLKYFFTITLPAFLFSQKGFGQKKNYKEEITQVNKFSKTSLQVNEKDSFQLLEEVVVKAELSNRRVMGYVFTCRHTLMGAAISGTLVKGSKETKAKSSNEINIYPNPIVANSKMSIAWKDNIAANQYVEIFDARGTLIQKEMISITTKLQNAYFWLKQMPAGFYIVRITDTKTLKKMSREFIVL